MMMQKEELAQKLNKVKGVAFKKAPNPAMQGILVKDGFLIASNMEMTVKAKLGSPEGETFIIPERAFDLINNLPDGEVEILATAKDMITIKSASIKNRYQTVDPEQFPKMAGKEEGSELTISARTLMESIRRVSYAIPIDRGNTVMASMCMQAVDGYLNFVGLDGHVLAWDRMDYDGEFELLIPKNTVDKLKSLGLAGDVQIRHGKNSAVFITDDFEVYTRLVEGAYFKYQNMFQGAALHTVISRDAMLDAMTRAKMCTEERSPVKLVLDGSSLTLSIKDNITDYQETVELQEEMPEAFTIGFDARLVLETLKAFSCGNVRLSFSAPRMPMVVEAEDSDFKAVVLPVNLG